MRQVARGCSWFLCHHVIRRFDVAPTIAARAVMGGLAFALLMLAERVGSALLFGRSPIEHFALYTNASGALGVAAQISFALIPLIQMRLGQRARTKRERLWSKKEVWTWTDRVGGQKAVASV
jgi:hypothetical protein